jgi:enterochelin esterase-like enzyme
MIPTPFHSAHLDGERSIWLDAAATVARRCVVVLDAELYLNRVGAAQWIDSQRAAGRYADTQFVYVATLDPAMRHRDLTCRPSYTAFLSGELVPWLRGSSPDIAELHLLGLSLSGLAAVYAAWQRPDVFVGAIAQSPSAWWNEEWLTQAVAAAPPCPARFWLSVGDEERQSGVSHPPTGLYQGTSQYDSVERLARQLTASGATVRLNNYPGGHDPQCWAAELPESLNWLLDDRRRATPLSIPE